MLYSPAAIAVAGVAFWVLLRLIAPLEVLSPIDGGTVSYIGICYVAFLFSCTLSYGSRVKKGEQIQDNVGWDRILPPRIFWGSSVVGMLGMAIRLYDRTIVRGVDYSVNQIDVRDQLASTAGSLYGATASLLLPFSFIPLILVLGARRERYYWFYILIASFIFVLPMLESLRVLSRSLSLISAMLAFFSWVCLRYNGHVLHRRVVWTATIGVLVFLAFSTMVFSSRLKDMNFSLEDSTVESGYAYTIRPSQAAMEGMAVGNFFERPYYQLIVPNAQYYLHGVYEFGLLYRRSDGQVFANGKYMFYSYLRVYNMLFSKDDIEYNDDTLFYRPGIFVTFFGELWVDYGWAGILFMGILGYLSSWMALLVRRGHFNILPLYIYCITGIFYMPVGNFLTSGLGFYLLHGFGLFALMTHKRFRSTGQPQLNKAGNLSLGQSQTQAR